jgi:hypothetical protein
MERYRSAGRPTNPIAPLLLGSGGSAACTSSLVVSVPNPAPLRLDPLPFSFERVFLAQQRAFFLSAQFLQQAQPLYKLAFNPMNGMSSSSLRNLVIENHAFVEMDGPKMQL